MTEIIDFLKKYTDGKQNTEKVEISVLQLNRVIKALEQEPCEDCISRAEAMTEIMMFAGNVKSNEENVYIKVSDAVQLLRELPPVNPQESKTGHWKKQNVGYGCSECSLTTNKSGVDFYRFCPNCGAKMESEDK